MSKIIRGFKFILITILTFFILMFTIVFKFENALAGASLTLIALVLSVYIGIRVSKPRKVKQLGSGNKEKANVKIPLEFESKITNSYSDTSNDDYKKKASVSKNKDKLRYIRSQLPDSFVVIDFETTGLDPIYDKVIEIGAVKYINGKESEAYSTLINPQIPISSQITSITGITNNMVKDAPVISNVINDFIEFIGVLPLVAHNATFDIKFLLSNTYDANIEISNSYIDTLYLCRRFMPDLANHKLGTICNHLCIKQDSAHRALDDCKSTAQVYLHCREYELNNKSSIYGTGTRENAETTEFELSLFDKVKNILDEAGKPTEYIDYIDTKSNFSIVIIGGDCYVHELMKFTIGARKKYFTLCEYGKTIHSTHNISKLIGPEFKHEIDSNKNIKLIFETVADMDKFSKLITKQYEDIEAMLTNIS